MLGLVHHSRVGSLRRTHSVFSLLDLRLSLSLDLLLQRASLLSLCQLGLLQSRLLSLHCLLLLCLQLPPKRRPLLRLLRHEPAGQAGLSNSR